MIVGRDLTRDGGSDMSETVCSLCGGNGYVKRFWIAYRCERCKGTGVTRLVGVPARIPGEERMTLAEEIAADLTPMYVRDGTSERFEPVDMVRVLEHILTVAERRRPGSDCGANPGEERMSETAVIEHWLDTKCPMCWAVVGSRCRHMGRGGFRDGPHVEREVIALRQQLARAEDRATLAETRLTAIRSYLPMMDSRDDAERVHLLLDIDPFTP